MVLSQAPVPWGGGAKRMSIRGGLCALLSVPMVLWAGITNAASPEAKTVPFAANAPLVPHDIVTGIGGGPVGFGPLTSITISSLSTCSADDQIFSLNGTEVDRLNVSNAHCTCSPPVTSPSWVCVVPSTTSTSPKGSSSPARKAGCIRRISGRPTPPMTHPAPSANPPSTNSGGIPARCAAACPCQAAG